MKKEKLVQFIREGETGYKCCVCNASIDEADLVILSKKFMLYKHEYCESNTICFVCGLKLKAIDSKQKLNNDLIRHTECGPGSPAWLLKFKNALTELEYKLFLGGGNGEDEDSDS